MKLATYLESKLVAKPYEWSIDTSWSGSVYINYVYGSDEQEDEGYDVRTSIRFADHSRPAVVTYGGVYEHSYLLDIRVDGGIHKGYVDAIIEYADKLILKAQEELANDDSGSISWNDKEFDEIRLNHLEKSDYEQKLDF